MIILLVIGADEPPRAEVLPVPAEDLGLTKALHTLIHDFAVHVPEISWQVDLVDLEGLFPTPVQTIIYRIVQEALTNISKHANSTEVTITLGSQESGGLGLAAMEERLNMVGGSFDIHRREQEGTRLSFTIPTLPAKEKP